MAEKNDEAKTEEINLFDKAPKIEEDENSTQKDSNNADKCDENNMPSKQQEEEIIKKKYGGLLPKKPPLISKDTERAFFDSADWALGKVGVPKSKGPLEALRPKLQPTRHQQIRTRSAYASGDEDEGGNQGRTLDDDIESSDQSPDNQNHIQN
ncbi:hypothetical protein CASFOL_020778 [Castilleja foliolosa]|uniref:Endosulphine n=1 Tax=Castilleja foliolosa TaxID=1961234 RepID=A0ABD3D1U4_9LAMI